MKQQYIALFTAAALTGMTSQANAIGLLTYSSFEPNEADICIATRAEQAEAAATDIIADMHQATFTRLQRNMPTYNDAQPERPYVSFVRPVEGLATEFAQILEPTDNEGEYELSTIWRINYSDTYLYEDCEYETGIERTGTNPNPPLLEREAFSTVFTLN